MSAVSGSCNQRGVSEKNQIPLSWIGNNPLPTSSKYPGSLENGQTLSHVLPLCYIGDLFQTGSLSVGEARSIMMNKIPMSEERILEIIENLFYERSDQVALALQILKEEDDEE